MKGRRKRDRVPVIEVKGLIKRFQVGNKMIPVLRGVDLEICFGEFAIIYGPSGCGKTTLLNTILGMEVPTSGLVIVKGENLFEKSEEERTAFRQKRYGMVFQQANWIKSLDVAENVALPLNIAGLTKKRALARANNLLKLVGIEEMADRVPTELSGGEQQRAGIARALASNPWIIVADEPTGNLDRKSGFEVMDMLKSLNERAGRTIVLVTHNPKYHPYATQLLHLEDGKITKEETASKKKTKTKGVIGKAG